MKRIFLMMVLFTTVIAAKAQHDIVVDPNAEVRTLYGTFNSIRVSGGIDLYLSQSADEAVAVSASEERFRNNIKTTVENGVLKISYHGDRILSSGNKKLKAYVSFKTIEKLEASGAADIKVSGAIQVASLSLHLSGASDFKGAVKVSQLDLDLSGASDVTIEGSANTVNIETSGASDVKAYGLVTDMCTAGASGASDINITVNKELNANASGASHIYFAGNASVKEMHSSGASSIMKKS